MVSNSFILIYTSLTSIKWAKNVTFTTKLVILYTHDGSENELISHELLNNPRK